MAIQESDIFPKSYSYISDIKVTLQVTYLQNLATTHSSIAFRIAMGSGASSALDEASMQQFISEDLERAEEVLATAQQPLGIALAQLDLRCAIA